MPKLETSECSLCTYCRVPSLDERCCLREKIRADMSFFPGNYARERLVKETLLSPCFHMNGDVPLCKLQPNDVLAFKISQFFSKDNTHESCERMMMF